MCFSDVVHVLQFPDLIFAIINKCVFCVIECARVFHAAGARLVLCGRDAGRLQQVIQELTDSSTGSQRQVGTQTQTRSQT